MFITLIVLSLAGVKETPERDNTNTNYCVSESVKHTKGEQDKKIEKSSCKKGSTEVDSTKPGLAERKSK